MKTRVLISAIALALVSSGASATFFGDSGNEQKQSQGQSQGQSQSSRNTNTNLNANLNSNRNSSSSRSTAVAGAAAGAISGAASYSGGSTSGSSSYAAPSTSQSSSGGNTQSLTYTEAAIPTVTKNYVEHTGTQRIANTPDVGVFAPAPTAPCIVTWGAGGSGPGLGIGLSGWKEDEGCTIREIRRVAADNPAIVKAADEYLLETIAEKRAKQQQRKAGFFAQSKGGFGY
jgi:hypothetical protein